MATQPETQTDNAKADAAAEKAYAAAAGEVSAKKAPAVDAPKAVTAKVETPKVDTPKIDRAVAAVKAAPKKKVPVRKARKTAVKTAARKSAAPKKSVAKAAPAKKPATKATSKTTPKTTATKVPSVAQLKDRIMATAKKTTDTDFAAKAKELAADAQTRAKAAYDKFQAYAGEMTEFTKGNVEAIVESGKILGAGVQDMARGEVAVAKSAFETATADMKAMAAVKSPAELLKLQGEIARRNFDAAVAHYSKNAETGMKIAGDAFAPISSRMSLAAEKFSNAA